MLQYANHHCFGVDLAMDYKRIARHCNVILCD